MPIDIDELTEWIDRWDEWKNLKMIKNLLCKLNFRWKRIEKNDQTPWLRQRRNMQPLEQR